MLYIVSAVSQSSRVGRSDSIGERGGGGEGADYETWANAVTAA